MDFEMFYEKKPLIEVNLQDGDAILAKITETVMKLRSNKKSISVAESCTGGLIGKLFTDVPGASEVFAGGMITYTNKIKSEKLGVSTKTIEKYTEVSFECACEMAARAREYFETDFAVSVTGFAGPGGGTEENPVGTVFVGIASESRRTVYRLSLSSMSRDEIRFASALFAVNALSSLYLN